jgi:hypothetical protein
MAALEDPEQEPLLVHHELEEPKQRRTPLPKLQLAVVLLLLATQRISQQIIVPFLNQVSKLILAQSWSG